MFKFFIVIMFMVLLMKCIQNKIIIRVDTFFRKGFRKNDDDYGIYCWVRQTAVTGKSYSCADFIDEVRGDKKVITNQLKYAQLNPSYAIYEPNFYDIVAKFNDGTYDRNYIIFYDELFTLLEKGKLSKSILTFISQLRKRSIYLVTTVQEWLDINVTFRRYVRFQIDCSMFNLLGICAFSINQIHDGYKMHWDNDLNEYDAPIIKTTIKKCSKRIADSYDTFEVISIN